MPSIAYGLLFLFFINILLEPTTCAIPEYLQNLEFDDITSLWDKFPSIIGQIKQAINRFRCPKGWRRLGGSCYYLSNITSTPIEANQTCNQLHSNNSNLMQIRNTVELFYAAHVLTKHNLTALMIELDPNLLKGKTMTDILMEDQGRWQRMKDKFREIRIKYYKLKDKVIKELESAGLRISRRSKKIKQTVKKRKEKYFDEQMYDDYDYLHEINQTNETMEIDEYEYENLDEEENDNEFERLDDISGICDQVDWNVLDNNATVYMLTTFLIEEKIVCSISNIEPDFEYDLLCEYVLDFCFANVICGKHGRCVNTLSGFKCSCSFLYGGVICEKISRQGKQIIIGIVIIIILYGLSFKPARWFFVVLIKDCAKYYKHQNQKKKQKKKKQKKNENNEQLVNETKVDQSQDEYVIDQGRPSVAEEILDFILPQNNSPLKNPNKRDLIRVLWVGGLSIIYLFILLFITTITHFSSFKYDVINETTVENLLNETIRLVAKCGSISNYRTESLIFFPVAVSLIFLFSWSIKREKRCVHVCDSRPGLIAPIEPFRTANRFTTATVFGILAFEVLKIFEELLFASADPLNRGILIELLERVALVILIGLRYYPVLASLQLRNVTVRFFSCLYMITDIVYTIIREGSCMGFLPLGTYYAPLEEAKLRMELGTWFIVYGLVKNTPHFILLSYITAELCVRFAYDSIYVPIKKKRSIWLAPVAQPDESAFAKFYVTKLFRRNVRTVIEAYEKKVNVDDLIDYEHENRRQTTRQPSTIKKFLDSIYIWNDDFRFTTMATCTYSVAVIFLYYLACTLVFLYVSRTAGHISFIRYYIESALNIEFKGFFSLRSTIIWSALITVGIYLYQLFIGIKNYKKHKLQLFKGIYEDVPSAQNFKPNAIASKSVHYSGFLVGYMAWGFVICFHLIFFIMLLIHILSLQIRYFEIVLAFTVPVLVVYLLKMASISSAGKFFFIQDMDEKLNLKNRKVYAIFVYFNFFADCFLGIASCIIRLCKAMILNIVYMARLDCSFLGRPLEKFDLGFAAYVSYLHMEVTHTNPIMLAFCYSLYEDVVTRREKHCYDDECCIAPGELEDDDNVVVVAVKPVEQIERKSNGSATKKSQIAPQKIDEEDEKDGLSINEIKPKAKSRSPSIASDKSSQKSKPRRISIDKDIKEEEDGGQPPPCVSTIGRLIPEEQPHLPPISPEPPPIPKRKDIPSEKEDDDDDDDDDGGIKPPSFSTIEKVIPHEAPHLLPIQRSSPSRVPQRDDEDDDGAMSSTKTTKKKPEVDTKKKDKPIRKKEDDDDDEDGDGGVQPPSISTLSKIIPKQQPHLSPFQNASAPPPPPSANPVQAPRPNPVQQPSQPSANPVQRSAPATSQTQQSGPPRIPQRKDIPPDDDDNDDDGGINPKVIAKQREEVEKKKKKKEEELKQKKQLAVEDDLDDDGGVSKPKKTKEKKPNTSKVPLIFEDEDDDGGVSKEKRQATEKKKKELEEKKKQKEQTKKTIQHDDDEDDDGAPKQKDSDKKKKPTTKKISKTEILKEEDEDDDGGRIVKTYDTIRTIMPSKQPVLDHQTKSKSKSKSSSPDQTDDGSMLTSQAQQEPLLKSYDIVGRFVSPGSTGFRRLSEENHYDTIPTDEERVARSQAAYSPPSYSKASSPSESVPLRTTSYREAQQNTPPVTQKQSNTSSIRSRSTINDDSSHYSEITHKTASSGVINRSYSHTGSIRSTSNHSIKPSQSKQSSQYTLKEDQQTEESTVESEEKDDDEKEEEEVMVKKAPAQKPSKGKPSATSHVSTAFQTISHLVDPKKAAELKQIAKRKQARFRWFLAYTILNNYHLFDLRKRVQSRLARLHIERSNPYDEQQYVAMAEAAPVIIAPESPDVRQRKMKIQSPPSEQPAAAAAAPTPRRLLSVPVPAINNFPQSPAERYVAIRSSMLYDVNAQQANTSRSPHISQLPSVVNQQVRFKGTPTVVIEPPSEGSATTSISKRPPYQRQETEVSDPFIINQLGGTPTFQAIPDSGQSTADYPLANDSSITNFSTLRTQMSHAQHMQAWRQNQLKKIQKKRPHCYHYGPPLQQSLEEKIATAAILTPQILVPTNPLERLPSSSPFQYPNQMKTVNEKQKKNQSSSSTTTAITTDSNQQEKSIKKKPIRATSSSMVQRKDSQTSFSNVTEV